MTFASHADATRAFRIRQLNDGLRVYGRGGRRTISPALEEFGEAFIAKATRALRSFDDWRNDPYRTHDYGEFVVDRVTLYFAIAYYDRHRRCGAYDPSSTQTTRRVLTLGLLR